MIAIYQVFDTADEPLTLGLGNDRIFRRFCESVGRVEWADEERYNDNEARRAHREELVALIQEVLVTKSRGDWLELFDAHDIPAGPINTLADVTSDPHLLERGVFFAIPVDEGSPVPQVGTGWQLDGSPNGRARRPPALGADTEEVFRRWSVVDPRQDGRNNGRGAT